MAYLIWSCVSVKSEAETYLIKKRDKEAACQESREQHIGLTTVVSSLRGLFFLHCYSALTLPKLSYLDLLIHKGFPHRSVGKESPYNAGDPSSILGSGRSAGERVGHPLQYSWASPVAQLVKNPPAMWETWVEEGKEGTHSVYWPGEFRGLYSPWGLEESDMAEWFSLWLSHPHTNILSPSVYQSNKEKS